MWGGARWLIYKTEETVGACVGGGAARGGEA